ncbi:MAG: winged helix-turn-helix domain-containing protein [Candidatus Woesearchaeota archaeon]
MVGNLSNYTKYDIVRCFLLINKNGISRHYIAHNLDIGEGTVRTILNKLKKKGLIKSNQMGHALSQKGEKVSENMHDLLRIKHDINVDFFKERNLTNTAILLMTEEQIKFDIFQRDAAIKNGADSCLILVYKNRKLHLHLFSGSFDLSSIKNEFKMHDNNLIVITFAKEKRWADVSGLAVIDELMQKEGIKIFEGLF